MFFLFISGIVLSQTTVTLQDQCNCEVLSGTDVSAAGDTTPAGADLGDLYVNTDTGTIFYWDGDSWELTSTNGATGNGISSVVDNNDGTFTFNFTDNTNFTTSDLTGPVGATGAAGIDGATGATGATGAQGDPSTDDQTASEVNSDSPIDVDGDGTNEATVEDVIQDIAPITSASGRIFYPPSIAIDASVTGTFTVDLYQQYLNQFDSPIASSEAVPIPTYTRTELYYYVTEADINVFGNGTAVQNMSIDSNGILSYQIFNQPTDFNSLINVVFVVK